MKNKSRFLCFLNIPYFILTLLPLNYLYSIGTYYCIKVLLNEPGSDFSTWWCFDLVRSVLWNLAVRIQFCLFDFFLIVLLKELVCGGGYCFLSIKSYVISIFLEDSEHAKGLCLGQASSNIWIVASQLGNSAQGTWLKAQNVNWERAWCLAPKPGESNVGGEYPIRNIAWVKELLC